MPTRGFKLNSARTLMATALLVSLSGTASAQNALGTGNALDANSGQSGRSNYQRPNFSQELNFRNSVATGNAAGGLSFRGDLGYRAAGEFTGALGSDSLFAFRRDSLYSGLAGMGIRGTDALQYQFALTTGSTTPRNLTGNLSLSRESYYNSAPFTPGSGSSSRDSGDFTIGIDQQAADLNRQGNQLGVPDPLTASALQVLESSPILGSLRSSSTYQTTSNLQPSLLSVYTEGVDRKPVGLIASPLLGITSTPLVQEAPKRANPLVVRPMNADTDPTTPGGFESTRVVTSYDALVEQMQSRVDKLRESKKPADPTGTMPAESNEDWLTRQMKDLREKIFGRQPANDGDPALKDPNATGATSVDDPNSATDPKANPALNPDGIDIPTQRAAPIDPITGLPTVFKRSDPSDEEDQGFKSSQMDRYDPNAIAIDPQTLEVLRGNAAQEVGQLMDPGAMNRDLFSEHITTGERLLSEGRYFDAEERFTHALSLKPLDVSSQLGRFHAQIGAGMVLSASVNLQSMFSQNPEVIASRYSGKLLPSRERLDLVIARLKERAGLSSHELSTRSLEGARIRVSSSLLLAYIGYQINDRVIIEQGLKLVKELGSDTDRRFASLLAQVWLGQDIPVPEGALDTTPSNMD
jgi:hypothetical protein